MQKTTTSQMTMVFTLAKNTFKGGFSNEFQNIQTNKQNR